jgi:hypothetical protein
MKLRAGSLVLVVALLAAQLAADAQQARQVYRVGYLEPRQSPSGLRAGPSAGLAMDMTAPSRTRRLLTAVWSMATIQLVLFFYFPGERRT